MQISLITALFNRLDLTRACVESVRRTLRGWTYEWIFVDDGSTDGTREFLGALAAADRRVRVVLNDAPRGFAANNNHGARLARAGLLCLLNNDTVVLPGWLAPMARLARRVPDAACVGNVQREPVSGLVDHAGIYFDLDGEARHAAKDAPAPPREDFLEWPAVTAACCVVRREVFLKLGGFDEAFRNGSEDTDFCLRAGTRGYRHYVANRSVIYHHISASPGRKQGEENNRRRFRERWLAFLQGEGRTRRPGRSSAPRAPRPGLLPRAWWRALDFWRPERVSTRGGQRGPTQVFLVVHDTALTPERAGVPTAVRGLAGAFGRMNAPVTPVIWKRATRSLGVLPPELSVGLDAERLRPRADETDSTAPVTDPVRGDLGTPYTDPPSLHDQPPGLVAPGAWILLPEVWDRDRTERLAEYAHRHGWRLAVVFYGAAAANEPQFFPWGAAHECEEFLRAISGGVDLLLPVSGTAAEHWRLFVAAKGLPSPPVRVCGPGADTCARDRGVAADASATPTRILCVSAVTPPKNHRALLAAFELALAARPDLPLELTLVGTPRLFNDDNVPAAVRAFAERHPGRVTWTERVEYSALRQLYEAAAFTVFPSVLESWGLPIVESLWFGKPCICANFGAMAETAAGGGCLTVDVRDPQALAEAILALAGSPERRAALAAEIAARPLKRWEDYTHELLAVLAAS